MIPKAFECQENLLRFSRSKYDPALFCYYHKNILHGLCKIRADDFICEGTIVLTKTIWSNFQLPLNIGLFCTSAFIIFHSINQRTKSLKYHAVNQEEKALLGSLVGQTNWFTNQSRPDIRFDVLNLVIA